MEKLNPCKQCGSKNFVSGQTRDNRFRIRCRNCGYMVVSETSPEEVITEWNGYLDGPQIPPDPNIPVSPDGKFQIYQLKMKKDGVHRIVYAVPSKPDPGRGGYSDSIHETLEEAVKQSAAYRVAYEESLKQKIEEQRLRDERIAEQKKREYMYGFDDGKSPMQRGRIIQHMQKIWNFPSAGKAMTMRDFIHYSYMQGNVVIRIFENKYNAHGYLRDKPKLIYYVNDTDVGKTAYEYMEYLIKNKIKIEA